MKKTAFRFVSTLLLLTMLLGGACIATASADVTFSDVRGHWGETYVYSGVQKGYIKGYTDGTFKPDKTVSRAEFSKMLNQAIGMNNTASVSFKDVPTNAWYYEEVRKAVSAGYISGYSDNTFRADTPITRQEAAVIVARVVSEPESLKSLSTLTDNGSIASWAQPYVRSVYTKGYMTGDEKGNFCPDDPLTRAAAAKVITLLLGGEKIISSNQTISIDDMKYENTLFANNVTVSSALGNGSVTLKNCRVIGTLTVNGGGASSGLKLDNTAVNKLTVSDSDGNVHILMTGGTSVKEATISSGAYLEENSSLTGEGLTDFTLSGSSLDRDTVKLSGDFGVITVNASAFLNATRGDIEEIVIAKKANLVVQNGDINKLTVEKAASNSSVNLSSSVTVDKATINASTTFTGEGEIAWAVENASGISYETEPDRIDEYDDGSYDPKENYEKLTPTMSPSSGSTDVSCSRVIKLTFEQTIYKLSGSSMTASYLEDGVIELRKSSASGSKVPFSVEISSSGRVVSITPDSQLSSNTKYYVIVNKGSIANKNGDTNPKASFSFTTEKDTYLTPTISPVNGKTSVAQGSTIKLTFNEAVYKTSGADLTSAYVENSVVELRAGSVDGPLKSFSAVISSTRKVITISPDGALDADTVYYVIVNKESLSDYDGNLNSKFTSVFSTGKTVSTLITFEPANKAESVIPATNITISFAYPLQRYGGTTLRESYLESTAIAIRKGSSTASSVVEFTASLSADAKTITLTPVEELSNSTTYYVVINENTLQYKDGEKVPYTTSYFKTNDGRGRISTLTSNNVTVTSADLDVTATVDGTVKLTIKPATGDATTKEVSVRAGVKKGVALTDLYPGTRYTVTATVTDNAGNTSSSTSTTFTTDAVTLELEATSITKNSAKITAGFDAPGKVTISYSPYAPKESGTVLSNFRPADGVNTKSVNLSELKEKTTYTVTLTFVSDNGKSTTKRITFTTDSTSTNTSLSSLQIMGADGTYNAVAGTQNTYTAVISASGATSVRLIPIAADEDATIKVNGKTVASGEPSDQLSITVGEETSATIVVTAESGDSKTYTLTITVNP